MAKYFKLSEAVGNGTVVLQATELGLTVTYIEPDQYEKLDFDEPIDAIIPEALEGVTADDFSFPLDIKYAVIPEGVTEIGEDSFMDCDSLEKIVIPEGVTEISYAAFYSCENLQEVQLPSTLKKIDENAFYECPSLEKIVIPEGVTEISHGAFGCCVNLKEVQLPSTLEKIGVCAFEGCNNLIIQAPHHLVDELRDEYKDTSIKIEEYIPNASVSSDAAKSKQNNSGFEL